MTVTLAEGFLLHLCLEHEGISSGVSLPGLQARDHLDEFVVGPARYDLRGTEAVTVCNKDEVPAGDDLQCLLRYRHRHLHLAGLHPALDEQPGTVDSFGVFQHYPGHRRASLLVDNGTYVGDLAPGGRNPVARFDLNPLPEDQLAAVWQGCAFLIFPSLYEGFGIPILEAMSVGIPVLCSNVTSLPEVAGEAAIYFNPGSPQEIANSIQRIERKSAYREQLIVQGVKRLKEFSDARGLAKRYLEILQTTLAGEPEYRDYALEGISADGWILQSGIYLLFPPSKKEEKREWQIILSLPEWFPTFATIQVHDKKNESVIKVELAPGETKELSYLLPAETGYLVLNSSPIFSPLQLGVGKDTRSIGLYCVQSKIISSDSIIATLKDK